MTAAARPGTSVMTDTEERVKDPEGLVAEAFRETAENAAREERERIKNGLTALYHDYPLAIAILCDDHFDHSGQLLGEVRDAAAIRARAKP